MEKVLVISSNKSASEALVNFIRDSFRCTPKLVESAYQAKTYLDAEPSVELAVINSPLMDESGFALAEYIIEKTAANCIFMIKEESIEKISDRAEKCGIIIVGKPFSSAVQVPCVQIICSGRILLLLLSVSNEGAVPFFMVYTKVSVVDLSLIRASLIAVTDSK